MLLMVPSRFLSRLARLTTKRTTSTARGANSVEYLLSTFPLREVLADFPREPLSKKLMGGDEGEAHGR